MSNKVDEEVARLHRETIGVKLTIPGVRFDYRGRRIETQGVRSRDGDFYGCASVSIRRRSRRGWFPGAPARGELCSGSQKQAQSRDREAHDDA